MKKTILATAMMLMAGLTVAFAKDNEGVNNQIATSFNKDFSSATNISWSVQKNFTKATFTMNNQVMFAFYNEDGSLLATARNILSQQLPINLLKSVRKDYGNYWISDLFEIDKDGQTSYYITLENGDETLILKSNGFDEWSTYKRAKKI
jgi:hypothetical protein